MPGRITFGMFFEPATTAPKTSSNPAVQRLRTELETGHKRNRGRLSLQAKTELTKCIWSAILDAETEDNQIFDAKDPQAQPGVRGPDDQHVLEVDQDGWRQPWSLSKNQMRGDQVRKAKGKQWRKVPNGRICGKLITRGQRYYTCK